MTATPRLDILRDRIRNFLQQHRNSRTAYVVPSRWITEGEGATEAGIREVHPWEFFLRSLEAVLEARAVPLVEERSGDWTPNAVVYNMFVRTACAFDHDQNGRLDVPVNAGGWRETGTFLKAIALLPHVRSLGANTIHLLPVTSIGSDGKKGSLGSPYAAKNPYVLESMLSEPNVGVGAEQEFAAFVEAAHHLGIRVVVEFVFRTAAKDSDWVKEHPEWFYWIGASVVDRPENSHHEDSYGAPVFSRAELQIIHSMVREANLEDLVPPHEVYRNMFTPAPDKRSVEKRGEAWRGTLSDGTYVRIPGAFADWPPNDSQPPWGDVTYLRLFAHPDFNYVSYNTIRMYDQRLARKENINRELWETISGIVPYYQKTFGIDGVMIDMGHALPKELKQEIISRARSIDSGFAFWDENFSVERSSVDEGYNAVIGYQWIDQHHPAKFKNLLRRFSAEGYPLPFFATPETHNTPRAITRAGGLAYSKYAWALSNVVPAIPFIHAGFELGETVPINTGLDFSKDEAKHYPPAKLPLFSEHDYNWRSGSQLIDWIRRVSALRAQHRQLINDCDPRSFVWVASDHHDVITFVRTRDAGESGLFVIANSNMHRRANTTIGVHTNRGTLRDLLSEDMRRVEDGRVRIELEAGRVVVLEL